MIAISLGRRERMKQRRTATMKRKERAEWERERVRQRDTPNCDKWANELWNPKRFQVWKLDMAYARHNDDDQFLRLKWCHMKIISGFQSEPQLGFPPTFFFLFFFSPSLFFDFEMQINYWLISWEKRSDENNNNNYNKNEVMTESAGARNEWILNAYVSFMMLWEYIAFLTNADTHTPMLRFASSFFVQFVCKIEFHIYLLSLRCLPSVLKKIVWTNEKCVQIIAHPSWYLNK